MQTGASDLNLISPGWDEALTGKCAARKPAWGTACEWVDVFILAGVKQKQLLSLPATACGRSTSADFALDWLQIINQIKCCGGGVVLLMQYSASPARRNRLPAGRVAAGCDSQLSRPLRYLDLLVSLVVAQCFAVVCPQLFQKKKKRGSR